MDVYLDNDVLTTDATTLRGVIDAGLVSLADGDRLIVEIRLDGQTLKADEVEGRLTLALEAGEVQLITADKYELAEQTLMDVNEALVAAGSFQQQAAQMLQEDKPAEAMQPLRQALQIWQQAQQSILQSTQLLGMDLNEMTVDDQPAVQRIDALTQPLRTCVEQITNQDWVGLSDTLGYDMPEAVTGWKALIDLILQQLADRRGE